MKRTSTPMPIFVRTALADATRALEPEATARGLRLAHYAPPTLPDALYGSEDDVRAALRTLLALGVAEAAGGAQVLLCADLESDPQGRRMLAVAVADSVTLTTHHARVPVTTAA